MCHREAEAEVIAAYEQFDSKNVGAHIDGPLLSHS